MDSLGTGKRVYMSFGISLSEDAIRQSFPNLTPDNHVKHSNKTASYNCIAYAAGDRGRKWWPIKADGYYWPREPRIDTLDEFVDVFQSPPFSYEWCDNGELEAGFEKIAIYAKGGSEPTHMARQEPDGEWVSKMGTLEDIKHTEPKSVNGPDSGSLDVDYGIPVVFMKRPVR
jgi:hypothetical protein